ncbi:hypothetical protein FRC17_004844, partial [Serendipita sp. 399]
RIDMLLDTIRRAWSGIRRTKIPRRDAHVPSSIPDVSKGLEEPNIPNVPEISIAPDGPNISNDVSNVIDVVQNMPEVPTEILEVILDHALAIPFLLDSDCSPVDFYWFAVAHCGWDTTHKERASYGKRWKTLRAVCRRWKAIVDRHSKTWVRLRSYDKIWKIPSQTRRVDIILSPNHRLTATTDAATGGAGLHVEEAAFRNVEVLGVSEYYVSRSNLEELNKVFDLVAQSGPSIHSFIYEGSGRLEATHLRAVTSAFPLLTSLTLHANEINGTLRFPTLTSAWISAPYLNISKWDLPSLRHLALGSLDKTNTRIDYDDLELGLVTRQLQSLLTLCSYNLSLTPKFWAAHSSLELFGALNIGSNDLPRIGKTRALVITGPRIGMSADPHAGYASLLPDFAHLQTLITPNQQLHSPWGHNSTGFSGCLKYCADRGINWYIEYGQRAK